MDIVVDESKIAEAYLLVEKTRVLSSTLLNDYFDQEVKTSADWWKLAGCYYDNARIIMETVLMFVHDAEQMLGNAIDNATAEGGERNA